MSITVDLASPRCGQGPQEEALLVFEIDSLRNDGYLSKLLLPFLPDLEVTDKVISWTSWTVPGTVLAFMLSG